MFLPCQLSNNSNASANWKQAFAIKTNVEAFIQRYGTDRVGFLTLTFADDVQSNTEAEKRFNSLRTGILKKRSPDYIAVKARMQNGRIHYHLVLVCKDDIRAGNLSEIRRGNYDSANAALKSELAFWTETADNYEFGRTIIEPVRTPKALARYFTKNITNRHPADRGARLVRYGGNSRVCSPRFSGMSPRAKAWRRGVRATAKLMEFKSLDDFSQNWGSKWAYNNREEIITAGQLEELDADLPAEDAEPVSAQPRYQTLVWLVRLLLVGATSVTECAWRACGVVGINFLPTIGRTFGWLINGHHARSPPQNLLVRRCRRHCPIKISLFFR